MENSPFGELPKLIITEDGSNSLHYSTIGESYHSTHGAMLEAEHVYLKPNFLQKAQQQKNINVLEIGFGTGLNAFLTICKSDIYNINVDYTAIEAYPLSEEIYKKLNYPEIYRKLFDVDISFDIDKIFRQLHTLAWNERIIVVPNFTLNKVHKFLQDTVLPDEHFDSVYFDAFAPQYQPEMWTEEIFSRIAKAMRKGAVLSTYCCKGDVKRALKANNLKISKIPGFAGKREMLVAEKI